MTNPANVTIGKIKYLISTYTKLLKLILLRYERQIITTKKIIRFAKTVSDINGCLPRRTLKLDLLHQHHSAHARVQKHCMEKYTTETATAGVLENFTIFTGKHLAFFYSDDNLVC